MLLPEPLGPTTATVAPAGIVRLTWGYVGLRPGCMKLQRGLRVVVAPRWKGPPLGRPCPGLVRPWGGSALVWRTLRSAGPRPGKPNETSSSRSAPATVCDPACSPKQTHPGCSPIYPGRGAP